MTIPSSSSRRVPTPTGDRQPQRIQLSRAKGWAKPPDAVVVARPTRWGNPSRWQDIPAITDPDCECGDRPGGCFSCFRSDAERRRLAVVDFRALVVYGIGDRSTYPSDDEIRRELAGRDLCCWCPPSDPCHADLLLAVANDWPLPTATPDPREGDTRHER